MKKSWSLIPKILSGEKVIESRWYKTQRAPWNRIQARDTVFFKNSGEPVTIKAIASKVLQLENLTPTKVRHLLKKYGQKDGLGVEDPPKFYRLFKKKKYCILIFLKNPKKVKPFNIDKTGFGAMTAWISTSNIKSIQVN
jgi:hypothetical protein